MSFPTVFIPCFSILHPVHYFPPRMGGDSEISLSSSEIFSVAVLVVYLERVRAN